MINLNKATTNKQFEAIEELSGEILPEAYETIIPGDHINYLFEKSHSAKAIQGHVLQENYLYYLITNDNINIGYLGIELSKNSLIISKLYLLKSCRGIGAGTVAMSFVDQLARDFNISEIELTVHKENKSAIQFYTKRGFIITDLLFHQFENGHSLEGFRMVKVVST